jgi:hypothetical protein
MFISRATFARKVSCEIAKEILEYWDVDGAVYTEWEACGIRAVKQVAADIATCATGSSINPSTVNFSKGSWRILVLCGAPSDV